MQRYPEIETITIGDSVGYSTYSLLNTYDNNVSGKTQSMVNTIIMRTQCLIEKLIRHKGKYKIE